MESFFSGRSSSYDDWKRRSLAEEREENSIENEHADQEGGQDENPSLPREQTGVWNVACSGGGFLLILTPSFSSRFRWTPAT